LVLEALNRNTSLEKTRNVVVEWATYWNVFSRNQGKIWCAKTPQCHFWNHGFF